MKKKQRSLQRREEEKQNILGALSNNEIINLGFTLFRFNFNPLTFRSYIMGQSESSLLKAD